jgi:pimeloyl-ACP methyl ester carboxylesterase
VSEKFYWDQFPQLFREQLLGSDIHFADILGNATPQGRYTPLNVSKNITGLRKQTPQGAKILLGFSLGGMMAIEWAHRYPDEILGVVLINISDRSSPVQQRLQLKALKTILKAGLQKTSFEKERMILEMTTSSITGNEKSRIVETWSGRSSEATIKSANFFLQLGLAAQFKQKERPPSCPVLILTSLQDQVVSPKCSFRFAEKWNLQPEVHPTAGHDLTLDDPQWVIDRVKRWQADLIANDLKLEPAF